MPRTDFNHDNLCSDFLFDVTHWVIDIRFPNMWLWSTEELLQNKVDNVADMVAPRNQVLLLAKCPPRPGIEPGPSGWKPEILTPRPSGTRFSGVFVRVKKQNLKTVQLWSKNVARVQQSLNCFNLTRVSLKRIRNCLIKNHHLNMRVFSRFGAFFYLWGEFNAILA